MNEKIKNIIRGRWRRQSKVTNAEIRRELEELERRTKWSIGEMMDDLAEFDKKKNQDAQQLHHHLMESRNISKWDSWMITYFYLHPEELPPLSPQEES